MTVLFDRLAYMDHLKRAGLSEEHARAYTEALEKALRSTAVKTDRDLDVRTAAGMSRTAAGQIQTRRAGNAQKAFWKATEWLGTMLFFGAALGLMLAGVLK